MLDTYNYRIDFLSVKDFYDIHKILGESLEFTEYYGDLDSLYDCLTDMLCDISIIEIHNLENLKKFNDYDKRLIEVFTESKHAFDDEFSDRFFVTIIHKDGTREEIK